ncbi:hypothetical protein PILCRDRAFT_824504 [Piloderma croceum F 1598]|uniref:Secreted protein n=1 Tax=Piloderma croceum (strain F 1598) TaxID=765440 RepID=A0A0C3FEJ3_PILCF|nr:hypothetical protein PILCRDRAFT_824504 [Piloderma croceum F 1598]
MMGGGLLVLIVRLDGLLVLPHNGVINDSMVYWGTRSRPRDTIHPTSTPSSASHNSPHPTNSSAHRSSPNAHRFPH